MREGKGKKKERRERRERKGRREMGGTHILGGGSFLTLFQIIRICRKRRDILCAKPPARLIVQQSLGGSRYDLLYIFFYFTLYQNNIPQKFTLPLKNIFTMQQP